MRFPEPTTKNAKLALDTTHQKSVKGIPTWIIHVMQHSHIERIAGVEPGTYKSNPDEIYLACQRAIGVCTIDQYIATNPLSIGDHGYEGKEKGATTGAEKIIREGIDIDSPEAVVDHLEKMAFPAIQRQIDSFDEKARVEQLINQEISIQQILGPDILKTGYASIRIPYFRYVTYGYKYYFMAYALYPEVIERDFSLQADLALLNNHAVARAYTEANLPPMYRLDSDMADSRGTLVDIKSLDKIWFPHLARCLEPMVKTHVRMLWHCDGNLMEMVPRLIDSGIRGFQGFQYEHGMDYEKICQMKTKEGNSLVIIGGVSVSKTLPFGKPADVRKEMKWLVENGPKTGLLLGCSSSITPGVPWENMEMLIEGLKHYREHGRL